MWRPSLPSILLEWQPEMSNASHSQLWKEPDPSFAEIPRSSSRIHFLHFLKHTCVGRNLCIRYLPNLAYTLYFRVGRVDGKAIYYVLVRVIGSARVIVHMRSSEVRF